MQPKNPRTPEELLHSLRQLSDDQLVARLTSLAARVRQRTALLVAHLAELDTRDVHLRLGYSSLFVYCREALGLSEDEAYNRIEAARAARRFPVVLDLLAGGSVTLTAVRLPGRHLTAENHARVLESARGKRKAEVEEIVAALCSRDDVPASIRKVSDLRATGVPLGSASAPSSGGSGAASVPGWAVLDDATARAATETTGEVPGVCVSVGALVESRTLPPAACEDRPSPGVAVPATVRARSCSSAITPLSPGRYRYQLTISGSMLEKLRLAKDMLRHALPSGDDEAVLDLALNALLMDLSRKKFAEGSGHRCRGTAPGRRTVPAAVRRAVWVRDLGRCAFVGSEGRRCGEPCLRGVPPRLALRGGRTADRRQHPATVSAAQRSRGAGVLGAARGRGTQSGTVGSAGTGRRAVRPRPAARSGTGRLPSAPARSGAPRRRSAPARSGTSGRPSASARSGTNRRLSAGDVARRVDWLERVPELESVSNLE